MRTTTDQMMTDGRSDRRNDQMHTIGSMHAQILASISGASIMVIELAGSRLLAPYFGTGITVWGSLLGVVMFALACGYYMGGWIVDRFVSNRFPHIAMGAAGVWIAILAMIKTPILIIISGFGIETGPVIASSLLLIIPVFLLATVGPQLIRLSAISIEDIGMTSSKIYAVSTFGSIAGTFATAFWFLPNIGTTNTLIICGFALIVVSAWRATWPSTVLFIGFFITFSVFNPMIPHVEELADDLIYRTESGYNIISVYENAQMRSLKLNFLSFTQSRMRLDGGFIGGYYGIMSLAPSLNKGHRILWIGVAGGTGIRNMLMQPDLTIDAVEIDPKVLEVSKRFFGTVESDRLNLFVDDGRRFLREGKKYDIINMDAFAGGTVIPQHMVTREFFAEASESLSENGILMMNVVDLDVKRELVHAIANTASKEFESVHIIRNKVNYIIICSKASIGPEAMKNRFKLMDKKRYKDSVGLAVKGLYEYKGHSDIVFTDDLNNLDIMYMKSYGI